MDKITDKIFKYLITTSGLIVAVVVIGMAIDNFRVIFNLLLAFISFLLVGCVVYESFSYLYKIYKGFKKVNSNIMKTLIEKLKYCVMRWFSSPETFIKWYLSKKHGSVQLEDGTWAVNQSDEFHKWCYGEGYKRWKEKLT